jgi:hypothetical protein
MEGVGHRVLAFFRASSATAPLRSCSLRILERPAKPKLQGSEGWCGLVDVIRIDFRQDVLILYSMFPSELKASQQLKVFKNM